MAGKLTPIETNRLNVTRKPLSPHFPRSRSVTSAPATPEILPHLPDYAKTSGHRSLSTSKIRQKPNSENRIPHINLPSPNVAGKKPVAYKLGPFSSGPTKIEKARSVSRASAWALSPGRSPESWNSRRSKSCSGGRNANSGESKGKPGRIARVLSLFRPKKGGLVRDGDMHTLTCMHTRLLQWRYVNARAEASMKKRKHIAEASQ
ncbi:hypothetical protein AMTR_s00106p00098940 [Amborella trichopoda]|uniref:Uncharacterized protein n=1 Tax=Amborella trichopoda TaxID=13333 RepID=W1NZK1_AMBTC|nr:hypothetical protein AMTR_s00106p00098940 [Amborella trichopoda]